MDAIPYDIILSAGIAYPKWNTLERGIFLVSIIIN